jgi:hypothetical protein
MKKVLACSCAAVLAVGLLLAAGLGWYFLSSRGQLLQAEMACNGGRADACEIAATGSLARGERGRALEFTGQACRHGSDTACGRMAEATIFGDGIAQSPAAGRAFLEEACDSGGLRKRLPLPVGLLACRRLGQALSAGEGVARDTKRATELFDRACGDGDALSCVGQAKLASSERAVQLQSAGCHLAEKTSRFPVILRIEASGAAVNESPLTDEEVEQRVRDVFTVRTDKTLFVFWARTLSPKSEADRERITRIVSTVQNSELTHVLLLGEFEEYAAAVSAACTAAGEPGMGLVPPPPPPPPLR